MCSADIPCSHHNPPKPRSMGLSVINKPVIGEVNYQFAWRISYVASTAVAVQKIGVHQLCTYNLLNSEIT